MKFFQVPKIDPNRSTKIDRPKIHWTRTERNGWISGIFTLETAYLLICAHCNISISKKGVWSFVDAINLLYAIGNSRHFDKIKQSKHRSNSYRKTKLELQREQEHH